jgi:ABC-2 type transport system permease protein
MNQLPAAAAATTTTTKTGQPGGPAVEIRHLRKAYGNVVAQLVIELCLAAAGLVTVFAVADTAFGVPESPGALAAASVLAVAGLFPLGLVIAALAPTSGTGSVIGRAAFLPLMFFAGLWLPRALMPVVLRDISDYTPVGAAAEALQDAMQGQFPPAAPLLVLTGYALACSLLARRYFRWE